jgi:hypothetical protein
MTCISVTDVNFEKQKDLEITLAFEDDGPLAHQRQK